MGEDLFTQSWVGCDKRMTWRAICWLPDLMTQAVPVLGSTYFPCILSFSCIIGLYAVCFNCMLGGLQARKCHRRRGVESVPCH